MPESPEVQAFAEFLAERVVGRVIAGFEVSDFRAYKTRGVDPGILVGETVTEVTRHGKYIDLVAPPWHLVFSFGRHGWGVWRGQDAATAPVGETPPVVATLAIAGAGTLEVTDAGEFRSAALWVVPEASVVPGMAALGPDPADPGFARADVDAATAGRRKQVKAVLQEQQSFAGIGNAYSDEILHTARLAPTRQAATLDAAERGRLYDAMTGEIRGAITARRGIPPADLKAAKVAAMHVHGRSGEACPVCGGIIADISFSGASAQFCPGCQDAGTAPPV